MSVAGVVPTSQTVIGNNFGFDVSTVEFDVSASGFSLEGQSGSTTTFWIEVATSDAAATTFWETTTATISGNTAALFDSTVGAWVAQDPEGVYNFSGNCTTLGIEDNVLAQNLSLFPNPTNGDMTIDFARNFGQTNVQITSITGQAIMEASVNGLGSSVIGTSRLAAGIYFAQVSTENATTVIKFVKN